MKTPKKRKRVYRVEFEFLDHGTHLGDFSVDELKRQIKEIAGDCYTEVKKLKIRMVKV